MADLERLAVAPPWVLASAAAPGAERERRRLDRDGVQISVLQRCLAEGEDGTRLEGLVKVYVPISDAPPSERPYGFVFIPTRDGENSIQRRSNGRSDRSWEARRRACRGYRRNGPSAYREGRCGDSRERVSGGGGDVCGRLCGPVRGGSDRTRCR